MLVLGEGIRSSMKGKNHIFESSTGCRTVQLRAKVLHHFLLIDGIVISELLFYENMGVSCHSFVHKCYT